MRSIALISFILPCLGTGIATAASIPHGAGSAPTPGHRTRDATVSDIPGYRTGVLEWRLPAFPGGEDVTLNGTVEEVLEQLRQINPDYDADFDLSPERMAMEPPPLERRTDFGGAQTICGIFGNAQKDRIAQGIEYLRGLGGSPYLQPGPGFCARASCSWNSAIWVCNDNPTWKSLQSFGSIADGALHLYKSCGSTVEMSGQVFHPTNWNVIVRKDSC